MTFKNNVKNADDFWQHSGETISELIMREICYQRNLHYAKNPTQSNLKSIRFTT